MEFTRMMTCGHYDKITATNEEKADKMSLRMKCKACWRQEKENARAEEWKTAEAQGWTTRAGVYYSHWKNELSKMTTADGLRPLAGEYDKATKTLTVLLPPGQLYREQDLADVYQF